MSSNSIVDSSPGLTMLMNTMLQDQGFGQQQAPQFSGPSGVQNYNQGIYSDDSLNSAQTESLNTTESVRCSVIVQNPDYCQGKL